MIPGQRLHRLAARICSAKSLELVVEPAIADLQRERDKVALVRSYFAVLKVIGTCALDVSEATDDDRRAVRRALACSLGFTCALTLLFVIPPLRFTEVRGGFVMMLLVPQALPLAIPIALAFAVAVAFSGRAGTNVVKAMVLAVVAASLVSFAMLGWGLPAGNDAFRRVVANDLRSRGELISASPTKGPNEMSLSELSREVSTARAAGEYHRARQYSWTFHLRVALAGAGLALAGLLLALPVDRRTMRALVATVVCLSYWALIYLGEFGIQHDYLTPFAGAWLPNVVCFTGTIVMVLYSPGGGVRAPAPARR